MIEEINAILQFKRDHLENVILLSGNHDVQYWIGKGDTNRYDYKHKDEIGKLFKDNKHLFDDIAYSIKDKYLITHAGVTFDWYSSRVKHGKEHEVIGKEPLSSMCEQINQLWKTNKELFTFSANATKMSDYYGDSSLHSPIWIRPVSLWEHNVFGWTSGIIQIVGHTPFESFRNPDADGRIGTFCTDKRLATPEEIDKGRNYYLLDGAFICSLVENGKENEEIIFVDCLRTETACVEVDDETLEWKIVTVK